MSTLEPALVNALASTDPEVRMSAALSYARSSARCDAALLLCHKPDGPGYTILANDGYSADVADFFAMNIDFMPEYAQALRKSALVTWEEAPGFKSSYSALQVLQPAGFNNGMTITLRGFHNQVIGALVVNMSASVFPMDYRAPIGVLKQLFTNFVGRRYEQMAKRLTPREQDTIRLMKDGYSNSEIGARLHLSPRTVATHSESIYAKLGVRTRVAAVVEADRLGFFDSPTAT